MDAISEVKVKIGNNCYRTLKDVALIEYENEDDPIISDCDPLNAVNILCWNCLNETIIAKPINAMTSKRKLVPNHCPICGSDDIIIT